MRSLARAISSPEEQEVSLHLWTLVDATVPIPPTSSPCQKNGPPSVRPHPPGDANRQRKRSHPNPLFLMDSPTLFIYTEQQEVNERSRRSETPISQTHVLEFACLFQNPHSFCPSSPLTALSSPPSTLQGLLHQPGWVPELISPLPSSVCPSPSLCPYRVACGVGSVLMSLLVSMLSSLCSRLLWPFSFRDPKDAKYPTLIFCCILSQCSNELSFPSTVHCCFVLVGGQAYFI